MRAIVADAEAHFDLDAARQLPMTNGEAVRRAKVALRAGHAIEALDAVALERVARKPRLLRRVAREARRRRTPGRGGLDHPAVRAERLRVARLRARGEMSAAEVAHFERRVAPVVNAREHRADALAAQLGRRAPRRAGPRERRPGAPRARRRTASRDGPSGDADDPAPGGEPPLAAGPINAGAAS